MSVFAPRPELLRIVGANPVVHRNVATNRAVHVRARCELPANLRPDVSVANDQAALGRRPPHRSRARGGPQQGEQHHLTQPEGEQRRFSQPELRARSLLRWSSRSARCRAPLPPRPNNSARPVSPATRRTARRRNRRLPGRRPPRTEAAGGVARPAACNKFTAKLSLARATFNARSRTISILAPITALASGSARITLQSAGTTSTFSAPIDSANGRIRVTRRVTPAQARLGTGILTIRYPGDADTRPQVVRLRAADTPSNLELNRPTITADGHLRARGTVSARSQGVVRVQLEYVNRSTGAPITLQYKATISRGRWSLNVLLGPAIRTQIAGRCGTVHSYTLFTGYIPRRIRGEMRAFEVLPSL